ncbi:MAG: polysaccharide deacetylase family protein [Candidatus Pacebacteria bacterium]|nr:polysaccharide deacetylase family protein [Candidatus Paceibacterota bacterium]
MTEPDNFKHKIRSFLIFITYYSAWPFSLVRFCRYLKIPLLRVIAFHEIKDEERLNFEKKLDFLKRNFNVISPDDFLARNFSRDRINLLLTFDDAFTSWAKNVLPALKSKNLSAVFFVDDRGLALAPVLHKAGQTIGGHTVGHKRLTKITPGELESEIAENKKGLERAIGRRIVLFAYPFGDRQSFSQAVVDEVRKAGYEAAFTILPGFNRPKSDNYLLHRDSVNPDWSEKFLWMWLSGAYDLWKKL